MFLKTLFNKTMFFKTMFFINILFIFYVLFIVLVCCFCIYFVISDRFVLLYVLLFCYYICSYGLWLRRYRSDVRRFAPSIFKINVFHGFLSWQFISGPTIVWFNFLCVVLFSFRFLLCFVCFALLALTVTCARFCFSSFTLLCYDLLRFCFICILSFVARISSNLQNLLNWNRYNFPFLIVH